MGILREQFGDLWALAAGADALCLTTNGTVKRNGEGVMGRGVAQQATRRYPGIAKRLGAHLLQHGNVVGCLIDDHSLCSILAFPVKHQWYEVADLSLIEQSLRALVAEADARGWQNVLLPRPGCGNGQLQWSEVRAHILPLVSDRIILVDRVAAP